MTEENPKVDREGIHIDADLAQQLHIEEELDSNVTGLYYFPSPERRRISAWILLGFGLLALFTIPSGWMVAIGFALIAGWLFMASWPLKVNEQEALRVAAARMPFAVGHSSASVRFKGWRSRPRWSVVLYSASEPPDARGLVVVDAVTGEVVEEPYYEPIAPV